MAKMIIKRIVNEKMLRYIKGAASPRALYATFAG